MKGASERLHPHSQQGALLLKCGKPKSSAKKGKSPVMFHTTAKKTARANIFACLRNLAGTSWPRSPCVVMRGVAPFKQGVQEVDYNAPKGPCRVWAIPSSLHPDALGQAEEQDDAKVEGSVQRTAPPCKTKGTAFSL